MLLRKIDGEMNVQNGGLSAKLWNGDSGDMLRDWWFRFYVYTIATVVSQKTAMEVATYPCRRISKRWHFADIKNFTGDEQATLTVDRHSAIYFVYVYEIATNAPAADGGFRTSLKRHIADVKNIARKDQNRSKFLKYENLCLRNQAKRLEKFVFAATNNAAIDGIVHCFFPTITRKGSCSHLRKIIFRWPLTPPKNRDIHIVEFFWRFYLKQNHRYYKKKILIFYF